MSYNDYFDITYKHPEINQYTISDEIDGWKRTYPHKTFIELLKRTEQMLARSTPKNKHSIWIHGAYGTGKSQVAWALRSLLTCSDEEFDAYFDSYSKDGIAPLKSEGDLRTKLAGHRKSGKIVVASRFGSDTIDGPESLVQAIFDSLTEALDAANVPYDAGKTLRGGIVNWLEKKTNRDYFGALIKEEGYCHKGCFAGKSANDILATLKNDAAVVDNLVKEIRFLAQNEGITALRFSKDDLAAWIKEIIDSNNLKALILVWDEFSAFFKNNRTRLDTLQSFAELSASTPFNLVIITHFSSSILPDGDHAAEIIKDRFDPPVEIKMPENTAFELISDALKIKEAFRAEWELLADDLNERMQEPRKKVSKMLKDVPEEVFRSMLPFHPYAALTLKNIANLFDSNQRSMFTFISEPSEQMAFRWFIENHDPNNIDLLSVDMLWDYFYRTGKSKRGGTAVGKSNLDAQVCAILDVYPGIESKLDTNQQRVLKTVLMFQALAKKLNNPSEFLGTEENLRLAFEGVNGLETGAGISILYTLVNNYRILFTDEINGKKVYQAPMVAGGRDIIEIEKLKDHYLAQTKSKELIKNWPREEVLTLSKPLEVRFMVQLTTPDSFTLVLNQMLARDSQNYKMRALVVIGRNGDDAIAARDAITKALEEPRCVNVVFIDATSTELGTEEFEKWAEYQARSNYYAKKDQGQSGNANGEAEKVLSNWRDRISEGEFRVRTKRNPNGVICHSASEVSEEVELSVREKYPQTMEFTKGFPETLFNAATKSEVAAGVWGGCEHIPAGEKSGKMNLSGENSLLVGVKDVPEYWKKSPTLALSKVKAKLEQKLNSVFKAGGEGRIEFGEIIELLFDLGFMPYALHGYLIGYLLKEYANNSYRYSIDGTSVPLTTEKMTDGILNYFKKVNGIGGRYHEAFIEILTEEQRRFADLAKKVFHLEENASIDIVAQQLTVRVRDFQYPLWCFKVLPEAVELERYIDQFTILLNPANQKGVSLSNVATEIGKMAMHDQGIDEKLSQLLTKEKAQEAMNAWLDEYQSGEFRTMAKAINAIDPLADVRRCFGANGVWLWDVATGENEIAVLFRDYRIVCESTKKGFITQTNSFLSCLESWRDKVRNMRIPYATLVTLRPESKALLGLLKEIAGGGNLDQNDRRDLFFREITDRGELNREMIDGCLSLFKATYKDQLSGLDDQEMDNLYWTQLDKSSFIQDKPTYEKALVQKVTEIKSHQSRNKLLALWKAETGTETPADWSNKFKTPVMTMIPADSALIIPAKNAFATLNEKSPSIANVENALEFFCVHKEIFQMIGDGSGADKAFQMRLIGRYGKVLNNLDKVRERLSKNLGPDIYGWFFHPNCSNELRRLAESEYNLHCAELIKKRVDTMNADQAKEYLVQLVMDSLDVGLSILAKE